MFFKRKKGLSLNKYRIDRKRHIRYKNPLNIKKGLFKFKLYKVINLILIVGVLICGYIFLFTNYYDITNIEIKGNQIISSDDILDITNEYLLGNRLGIFKNKNIFVFSKEKLKEKISQKAIFNQINIEKELPNTIILVFEEKKAALKWQNNQQDYLVDDQGLIIKSYYNLTTPAIFRLNYEQNEADNRQIVSENDEFIKIISLNEKNINLGDKVINANDIELLYKIINDLKGLDYLEIKEITVPNNFPQFFTIKTAQDWLIYFNFGDSDQIQLERLKLLVAEKIKIENLSSLEYIDLRLGESVYFKYK